MNIKFVYQKYQEQFKEMIKQLKKKETRKKQIPNLLTASRLFSPLVILPLAFIGHLELALIATIIFASTDGIDGYLARKWNAISEFGRDLDAITDKLFATTILLACSFFSPILLTNLGLELIIGGINAIEKIKGNDPRTIIVGKFKTASLSILLITVFASFYLNVPSALINYIYGQTIVLQAITTVAYYHTHRQNKQRIIELINKEKLTSPIDDDNTNDKKINKCYNNTKNNEKQQLQSLRNSLTSQLNKTEEEETKSKQYQKSI